MLSNFFFQTCHFNLYLGQSAYGLSWPNKRFKYTFEIKLTSVCFGAQDLYYCTTILFS